MASDRSWLYIYIYTRGTLYPPITGCNINLNSTRRVCTNQGVYTYTAMWQGRSFKGAKSHIWSMSQLPKVEAMDLKLTFHITSSTLAFCSPLLLVSGGPWLLG